MNDRMPDGVDLDAGRVEQLLARLVNEAAAARAHLAEVWERHEAMALFEGQPLPFEPMEELAMMLSEVLDRAKEACGLVDDATAAYMQRQPDEFGEEAFDDEDDA